MKAKKSFDSCYILINPSRFPKVARYTKKVLKTYDASAVKLTESRDHFIREVKRFYHSTKFRYLIIWGGDGTAQTAITAYMCEKELYPGEFDDAKAIGFMRGGSGNGIQDSYEVPRRIFRQIESYAESVRNNYTIKNDLLEIRSGGRKNYGQLFGSGMDSKILIRRERNRYKRGDRKGEVRSGMLNYYNAIFRVFFSGKTRFLDDYTIELRGGKYMYFGSRVNAQYVFDSLVRTVSVPQIEAGSRPYYAKLFKICPHVICNDGLIDAYLYHFKDRASVLFNAWYIFTGKHNRINNRLARKERPIIEHYKVDGVSVSAPEPFSYHVDGELFTTGENGSGNRVDIQVLPRAIRFLVPPRFYRKFHPFDM